MANADTLAAYLRDRRARLEPAALGFAPGRRRTPGLRREEVAQRANISPTWYTWLEQGRGGAPSADVLDRLSRALLLTATEREHLFLLGLGRRPDVRFAPPAAVTPRLQRVLDAFETSPAAIRTATWDVVAWNRAATLVLTDYGRLPPEKRNILKMIFLDPTVRAAQENWHEVARFVVGVFRADTARAGAFERVEPLVDELSRASPEFAALWRSHEVRDHGEGIKRLKHAILGPVTFEFTAFAVDGRADLSMMVYNPADAATAARVRSLLAASAEAHVVAA